MLSSSVLVLNHSYFPVHITSLRRALVMLYQGIAKAVDEQYQTFDFETWADLRPELHHDRIGLIDRLIRVPRVLLLSTYDRLPKKNVRFSRYNIYLRDGNTCQYCGKNYSKSELNLDHVIPRSRGGKTTWENVVCSCIDCNRRKGGHLPAEAGMHLLRKPLKPAWSLWSDFFDKGIQHEEWKPFLNVVDFSYWNLELRP
ncbi:MAG TPA: HNH endonuclease [Deltaproteobacteria bacterium]|nr:HNH endonuclease [Deltaproteobacteria bacterium]